jgi:uncharacterized protein YukE
MTSQVDELKAFINDRIDDSDRMLDELEKYGPIIIRATLNIYLAPFASQPGTVNRIAELLIERLLEAIAFGRAVNDVHRMMVQLLGSPDALNAAADTLGAQVGDVTKTLSVSVNEDSLDGLLSSNWAGEASEMYARSFSGQHHSVDYINDFVGQLQSALHGLADEIFTFYSAVAGLAISLCGVIVGLALACTGAGVVAGAISFIGGVLGLLFTGNELLVTHEQTMEGIKREIPGETIPWASASFAT